MVKNISSWILTLVSILFFFATPAKAAEVNAYLFYGEGCPHCAKEKIFLQTLENKYPTLIVQEFEIYYNRKNNKLLQRVAQNLNTDAGGVPFLVVGDKGFVGFAEGFYADEIENKVAECVKSGCDDPVAPVIAASGSIETKSDQDVVDAKPIEEGIEQQKKILLPLLGEIDTQSLSLPVLTFVLALLDGFNPCAMWTLLFLISLLLGMRDRRRMWILGIAFIITSSVVYFLFLSAWLNLFLFLGFIVWVRLLVGVAALAAGVYYLRDYWINTTGGCNVTGDEKRLQFFRRLQAITQRRQFLFALGGIMALAVAVNMVELICSAGLPAIYTQILSLTELARWQYYTYLAFYILVFMLDDLFVFFTAMITLKAVGVESKYSRYSHLIGGILMLIIGSLLVFKPEWLMFG